jgi:membrane protease YdiL (CAAX protease family)
MDKIGLKFSVTNCFLVNARTHTHPSPSRGGYFMMAPIVSKLFRWQPSRETLIALLAGGIVIGLSAAMIPFKNWPWASIAIRDIGQILLMGILFPLIFLHRSGDGFAHFGLNFRRWYIFLGMNLVLGALLLFQFLSKSPPTAAFRLNAHTLWSAAFIMMALVFELIFFYAFLRTLFEQAFGIVPAVILTALFYAFHHIGFQPEYGKLIFVGVLYATVYRLGNSALLIYPFFLGVGGTYDVLIQSKAVSPILFPEIRTLYLAVLILAALIWTWKKAKV